MSSVRGTLSDKISLALDWIYIHTCISIDLPKDDQSAGVG